MTAVVAVEGIAKKYSRRSADHLSYGIADLWREITGARRGEVLRPDEFWAVDDVSFAVEAGESFALVGRNGSGKSTVLKLISGLIKPERGAIRTRGRLQALIALGAGFNPLLSGRDNVYVAAALLGLAKRETEGLLDAIVDFAELGDFIDSPVRTYSSGMYARLGFSLAVNLEPDILVIDEILSVGDFAFQNKCFARLLQLKKQGLTILLVSHNHTRVIQLCDRAVWINEGRTRQLGAAAEVVQGYISFLEAQEVAAPRPAPSSSPSASGAAAPRRASVTESPYGPFYDGDERIEAIECELCERGGTPTRAVRVHDAVRVDFAFRLREPVVGLNVTLAYYREDGLHLGSISTLNGDVLRDFEKGGLRCRVHIPDLNLAPGRYVLVMPIHEGHSYLYRRAVCEFVVIGHGAFTWGLVDFKYDIEMAGDGSPG